jgi:hypothetical protein
MQAHKQYFSWQSISVIKDILFKSLYVQTVAVKNIS